MVTAFVMINVGAAKAYIWAPLSCTSYKDKLKEMPGVKEVYLIFGRYDIMVHLEANTLEEILGLVDDKIRSIPGVQATETFLAF